MIERVLAKAGGRALAPKALVSVLVLALCALLAVSSAAASTSSPQAPAQDPFYTYGGSLAGIAPGTILNQRQVTIFSGGHALSLSAEQLAYRTTDELRQPTITVATVIRPQDTSGPNASKIVSFQSAYDALGSQCDPSYTLRGGNPSDKGAPSQESYLLAYVDQGYTVVVPDYEGIQLAWGAGQQSGYETLDGITATETFLGLPAATTPVALVGYSGGSSPTDFATELAPSYAPALHLVGAAEGGLSVEDAHTLAYTNGSEQRAGVMPALVVGVSRAFNLDPAEFETPYALSISQRISDQCFYQFYENYPNLTIEQMVKPRYHDLYSVPLFARMNNEQIMSRTGTPREPLLIVVGNSDGIGDGLVVARDDAALATTYCKRGVPVEFRQYDGEDHIHTEVPFEADAFSYLTALLDGARPVSNCGSFAHGISLAPLPTGRTNLIFRNRGPSARLGGVVIELRARHGRLRNLSLQLCRHQAALDTMSLGVTTHWQRIVLKASGAMPAAGYYTITVAHGGQMLLYRMIYFG